jgi:hypothetical protein
VVVVLSAPAASNARKHVAQNSPSPTRVSPATSVKAPHWKQRRITPRVWVAAPGVVKLPRTSARHSSFASSDRHVAARMFLERKFSGHHPDRTRKHPALCPQLPAADWSRLPEPVYDVICNLQLLLASRRGYSHTLPDFGLSASNGQHGLEARVEALQAELPAMMARYEPRFRLAELAVDVDDAGSPSMKLTGTLPTAPGALTFRLGIITRKILSFEYEPSTDK